MRGGFSTRSKPLLTAVSFGYSPAMAVVCTPPCAHIVCGHTHTGVHTAVCTFCARPCVHHCVCIWGVHATAPTRFCCCCHCCCSCCAGTRCTAHHKCSAFTTAGSSVPLRFQTNRAGQSKPLLTSKKQEAFLGHARPTRAHSSRLTRTIVQYHPRGGPT